MCKNIAATKLERTSDTHFWVTHPKHGRYFVGLSSQKNYDARGLEQLVEWAEENAKTKRKRERIAIFKEALIANGLLQGV
jgi:hypothetical protein